MRRVVLALAVGGVLLSAVGCGTSRSNDKPATPNAAPASAAPIDPGAGALKSTCEQLGVIYTQNMAPFAESLSKMVSAKSSPTAAQQSLKSFAVAIQGTTASSSDAQLRADGEQTATQLLTKAGDAAFFKKIKTTKDVNTVLGPNLKEWLSPVTHHCS